MDSDSLFLTGIGIAFLILILNTPDVPEVSQKNQTFIIEQNVSLNQTKESSAGQTLLEGIARFPEKVGLGRFDPLIGWVVMLVVFYFLVWPLLKNVQRKSDGFISRIFGGGR